MPTVTVTLRIAVPPEVVAGVLLDAESAPLWTAGLERLEHVAGEPGEPGCVGHAHYGAGRRSYVLVDVLEEVVSNRRFVSRVTGGGITARVETDLEPVGEGATELTLRWKGSGTNPLTRLLLPMMRRRIRRRAAADLDSLRELAEARGHSD
jgi:hypothetical protein